MRKIILTGVVAALVLVGNAYAQEGAVGAGRIEIGAFPGGGMFFTASATAAEPGFGNYAAGASFTVNVNRWIGLEGEGGGSTGMYQRLDFKQDVLAAQETPGMWSYSGNLVLNPIGSKRGLVPYVTGGIGGLTLCPCGEVEALGVTHYETYLTGNIGGGLKWFSTRHFGVRGDYRFFTIKNKDTAPLFFGKETRYGHRVQAGLIFTY